MYTNELNIEIESFAEILQAVSILDIKDLKDQCLVLFNKAKLLTLLEILETSHKQGARYICEETILDKICSMNFGDVMKLPGYNELCIHCFCLILSRYKGTSGMEVINSVIQWLQHSIEERGIFIPQLFSYVNLAHLSSKDLVDIGKKAPFLLNNKIIRDQILECHWIKHCEELSDNATVH
jgi:hypothetical protein